MQRERGCLELPGAGEWAGVMDYVFTAADRALFKRCRRAWDFGGTNRGNLEPAVPHGTDLDAADLRSFEHRRAASPDADEQ